MTRFEKAWIIPWEAGKLGVAYKTEYGGQGMRMLLENDPDRPALIAAMSDEDRKKVEEHFQKVVELRVPGPRT